MIRPHGYVFVSDKEAAFRRKVREEQQFKRLVSRMILAGPVQSLWNVAAVNPIEAQLSESQGREELRVGLADFLLEEFLVKWPGKLRLYSVDGRLHDVSPDVLFTHLDIPAPDLKRTSPSDLRLVLEHRARTRNRWFAFLSIQWEVLPAHRFREPAHSDDTEFFDSARLHLKQFAGAKLCVLTDDRLSAALQYIEGLNDHAVKKEVLAEFLEMEPGNSSFRVLWKRLRDLGIPVATRGKGK